MNDLPFDSASDSADDPLAVALRRLQPARCELDAAELYYRSGYAAAVADRRSSGVPPWALAASLLVVSGLSAAAGFAVGDAPALRPLATEHAEPAPPTGAAPAGPAGVGISDRPPMLVQEAPDADTDVAAPLPNPHGLAMADMSPSPLRSLEQPFPLWSGWLGWPWPASIETPPHDRLTIRPTEGQWQELVRLNVPAGNRIGPHGPVDDDLPTASSPRPMLSSVATEAVLRDLVH